MGDMVPLARRYCEEGADELVFYDITASPDGRMVDREWISRVGAELDIPFSVAGGIRSVADAETILGAGAEKISINTPALDDPGLIDRLAARFGSQCVVIGIDSRREEDELRVASHTGDPERTRFGRRKTLEWVAEVQERGAGEIVLNCMNYDGVQTGYDLEQMAAVRERCRVPLIASGGAGVREHFATVFNEARVDGALAATVFHARKIEIGALKQYLAEAGVEVRR
jgi:cyclase